MGEADGKKTSMIKSSKNLNIIRENRLLPRNMKKLKRYKCYRII